MCLFAYKPRSSGLLVFSLTHPTGDKGSTCLLLLYIARNFELLDRERVKKLGGKDLARRYQGTYSNLSKYLGAVMIINTEMA